MNSISTAEQPRRVKAAFMGSFAVALVAIMGVFVAAIYLVEGNVRERELSARADSVSQLFDVKLVKDGNLMRAVVHAMRGNPSIAESFRRQDRAGLEESARELFEVLRRNHRITHLYFTRPDRINLYRLHTPDWHGDRIDRATML